MKRNQWAKAKRNNGHPVPKLWIRNGKTYYAQMAVFDLKKGKNVTTKICLNVHVPDLKKAEAELAKLVAARESPSVGRFHRQALFLDFV